MAAESAVVAVAFAVAGTAVVAERERRRSEHWSPDGYLLVVRRGETHSLAAAAAGVVAAV